MHYDSFRASAYTDKHPSLKSVFSDIEFSDCSYSVVSMRFQLSYALGCFIAINRRRYNICMKFLHTCKQPSQYVDRKFDSEHNAHNGKCDE